MKTLSLKDVKHVATLAKLKLTDTEIAKFQKQLSKVVSFVGELNEVDTKGIEPTSQTTGFENVFRTDEINSKMSLTQDKALSGTDKTINGYFVADAVINKNE